MSKIKKTKPVNTQYNKELLAKDVEPGVPEGPPPRKKNYNFVQFFKFVQYNFISCAPVLSTYLVNVVKMATDSLLLFC